MNPKARAMRRACAELVADLDLGPPAAPGDLIVAMCERMSARLGLPVHLRFVPFPSSSVSGMWLETATAHYVLCEQRTSGWHQLAIVGHELWHIAAGHPSSRLEGDVHGSLQVPSLDPHTVARIVAARTACTDEAEQEAELFAGMLLSRVSRWRPQEAPWTVPAHAAVQVDALETTLGVPGRGSGRG